jgi:predicted ABC-type ATPase
MSVRKKCRSEITVLAGVNGAGKSSIGGTGLRENGADYFNPDEIARALMASDSGLSQEEANSLSWRKSKELLKGAIEAGSNYSFESTLGGNSMTDILLKAASQGAVLNVWYVGLESVEEHIQRVAARVRQGGHDIPESDIRRRWTGSHANLIRLIPWVTTLRVYDNSLERDPWTGRAPEPRLLLSIEEKQLVYPPGEVLEQTPAWAKPVVFSAYKYFGLV